MDPEEARKKIEEELRKRLPKIVVTSYVDQLPRAFYIWVVFEHQCEFIRKCFGKEECETLLDSAFFYEQIALTVSRHFGEIFFYKEVQDVRS